jgi:hypothetical protein
MKKAIFVLLLLSGAAMHAFSQKVNVVKISPQNLVMNTLNLTWERASSSGSKTSLNISPFVTFYDRINYNDVTEKLAGAGIELGKKLYISRVDSSSPLKGFYASASLSYGFYSADYQRGNDSSYISNNYYGNYTVYTSSGRTYHEDIHRIGADIFIGYQFPIKKVFYVDAFFGAGMRYGISSKGDDSDYKYSLLDFGHSGIIPKAGIKIGLKI